MQGIPRNALFGLIDVKDSFHFYYVVLTVSALALFLFYRIVNSPFGESCGRSRTRNRESSRSA